MLLDAPDVFYMCAILKSSPICNGKGDRTYFIQQILNRDPRTIKDLGRKLILLTGQFPGLQCKVFNDDFKLPTLLDRVRRKLVYRIWFRCRRTFPEALSIEELVAF
jgi:hypothetical protein